MAVYPFYVEVNSSTRKTTEGVGCKSKDGDMTTYIYQRDQGSITTPYKIRQYSYTDEGVLYLATDIIYQGEVIHSHITKY